MLGGNSATLSQVSCLDIHFVMALVDKDLLLILKLVHFHLQLLQLALGIICLLVFEAQLALEIALFIRILAVFVLVSLHE